jgi:hypothetical protein
MYESRRYEQDQRPRRNEEMYERRGDDRWMDSPRNIGDRDSSRSWRGTGAGSFGGGYDNGMGSQRSASQGGGYYGGPSEWGGSYAGTYAGSEAGPRENFSGRGPKGYQRSDDRIREQVCDRLTDDASLDASEIEVEVRNCEVVLKGTVRDRQQKRRAEDLVESCSGVKDVTNNIRVAQSSTSSQRMNQSGSQKANGKGSSADASM